MPIATTCRGCGKTIHAPDSAGGHKARCPQCGVVVEIPAPGAPADVLAALVEAAASHPSPASGAAPPAERSPPPAPSSRNGAAAGRSSATTVDRMLARTSPYDALRLLATVTFGLAIALAVIAFLLGLAGLIIVSIQGHPGTGVGAFALGLAAAAGLLLGGKVISELLRLAADVGDRTRHMAQVLEDLANHRRENHAP